MEKTKEKCNGCINGNTLGDMIKYNPLPFCIPSEEKNGAKNQTTNSENFHRHHHKLSKKISDLCEMAQTNKEVIFFLFSLIPGDVLKDAMDKWLKYQGQIGKIKAEIKKAEELKSKLYKLSIVK